SESRQLLADLEARGLITPHAKDGKPFEIVVPTTPRVSLMDAPLCPSEVRASHLWAFAWALGGTKYRLNRLGLELIAAQVASKRMRSAAASHRCASRDGLAKLSALFSTLRLFAYRNYDACLFDSLAMLSFMSCWSTVPLWIFGIRTNPFS